MDSENSLPHYTGPVDHMRFGFQSLQHETNALHPVQSLQRSSEEVDFNIKLDMVRRTYGSHMAMRLATERQVFSRNHRLPGLQSSRVHFDTIRGNNCSIDFDDFLNGKFLK